MKKLLFIMLAALTIVSCQKEKPETMPQLQEVSFTALEITPDVGLKSTADAIPCVTNIPDYAHFTIAGITEEYDAALFEVDGVLYTQAIKLPVQTDDYCVTQFFLFDDVNGDGVYDVDDVIVYATPAAPSTFEAYITPDYRLEYCFNVAAFAKAQLPIEVLCFQPALYDDFGFDWFAVTEIVVRQFCFFGDLCVTDGTFALYANSIYDDAINGVQADEEAVFRMIVKADGEEVPYSPFSNIGIYNTGKALCVDYPDNLMDDGEEFTFELQVWQPDVYGVFSWVSYTTFTSTDGGNLFYGTEDLGDNTNVTSFAVGDCSPDSNPIFPFITLLINETFEAYDADDYLVAQAQAMGRNYWVEWSGGSGTPEDPMVSDAQAAAGDNSVVIEGVNDAVGLVFQAYTEGLVNIDLDIYIPSGKIGFFDLLQEYTPTFMWGLQVYYNPGGLGNIDANGGNSGPFTFTYDTWHHVSVIIDLDADNAEMYINGTTLVKSWVWSEGAFGGNNLNQFQALNLYAYSDTGIPGAYFDNILITIIK